MCGYIKRGVEDTLMKRRSTDEMYIRIRGNVKCTYALDALAIPQARSDVDSFAKTAGSWPTTALITQISKGKPIACFYFV